MGSFELKNDLLISLSKSSFIRNLLKILPILLAIPAVTKVLDDFVKFGEYMSDGLIIYGKYIVDPLRALASSVGVEYSNNQANVLIIMSIIMSISLRLTIEGSVIAHEKINEKINEKHDSNIKPKLRNVFVTYIIGCALLFSLPAINNEDPNVILLLFLLIFFPVFLVLPKVIMSKVKSDNAYYLERNDYNYFKYYYGYITIVVILVSFLGAIDKIISNNF